MTLLYHVQCYDVKSGSRTYTFRTERVKLPRAVPFLTPPQSCWQDACTTLTSDIFMPASLSMIHAFHFVLILTLRNSPLSCQQRSRRWTCPRWRTSLWKLAKSSRSPSPSPPLPSPPPSGTSTALMWRCLLVCQPRSDLRHPGLYLRGGLPRFLCKSFSYTDLVIIILEICKMPTPRLKVLSKQNIITSCILKWKMLTAVLQMLNILTRCCYCFLHLNMVTVKFSEDRGSRDHENSFLPPDICVTMIAVFWLIGGSVSMLAFMHEQAGK